MHRKRVGNKAEGCVFAGSLKPLFAQAAEELVATAVEDFEAQNVCQGTGKKGLEMFHYRRVFREDQVVECSMSKELMLAAGQMLRQKAAGQRVRRFDVEQQENVARLQKRVKCYGGEHCPS